MEVSSGILQLSVISNQEPGELHAEILRFAQDGKKLPILASQRDGDGVDDFAKNIPGGLRFFLQRGVTRAGDNAMRENGDGQVLEIVGEAEIAAIEEGASLCSALEHQGAARADAENEMIGFAGAIDDFESVIVEARIDFNVRNGFLHREDFGDVCNGLQSGDRVVGDAAAENFALGFVRGVTHFDAHEETVKLGFRKRIGAVMLDGILRGDDEERLGEWEGAAVDGNLRFVHGFKKSGLRAGSGAIDFVGENDVGKDGALAELELAGLGIIDADAENIGGEKIGSKLDTLKGAVKRFGESLGESGFAGAGDVFDEQMAASEKSDEGKLDDVFLAVDSAGNGALQLRDDMRSGHGHWLKTLGLPVTNRRRSGANVCGWRNCLPPVHRRAISSAVRALASHARGQRFKSFIAHHSFDLSNSPISLDASAVSS